MPAQSPGVFIVISFSVLGATLLLYVLVRLVELCHRLSLKLCRPQYEHAHQMARRWCCCVGERKEVSKHDFERSDGTLVELSASESGGEEQDAEADQDQEARLYQETRART